MFLRAKADNEYGRSRNTAFIRVIPKDFVWTGWHPQDMCYCVSILKTDDEFWRDLGEENPEPSENEVTDVPEAFKDWVKDNEDRIEAAEKRGTTPYFVADNKEYIDDILKPSESNSESESGKSSQGDIYRGNIISRISNNIKTNQILNEFLGIDNAKDIINKAESLISESLGNSVKVTINEEIMPLGIAKAHLTEIYSITKSYRFQQGNITNIVLGYVPKDINEYGITTTNKTDNSKTIKLTQFIDPRDPIRADNNSRCDKSRLPFSLATHETTHAIFSFNAPYNLKTAGFREEMVKVYNDYQQEIAKYFLSNNGKMVDKISIGDYGSSGNVGEFMAECFQEYRNSSHPSKYAKIVGKLIDSHFRK